MKTFKLDREDRLHDCSRFFNARVGWNVWPGNIIDVVEYAGQTDSMVPVDLVNLLEVLNG